MKLEEVIDCIVICSFIFLVLALQYLTVNDENFKYFNETRKDGLMGVYYQDSYYCVWVKDRSEYQIKMTECHELCHHFVYNDKEHFCD